MPEVVEVRLAQWPSGLWSSSIPGPEGWPIILTAATKEEALHAAEVKLGCDSLMVALMPGAPLVSEHAPPVFYAA